MKCKFKRFQFDNTNTHTHTHTHTKYKNESKTLTNHISCKSNCKFYSKKRNSNQKKVTFCRENSWQFSELM